MMFAEHRDMEETCSAYPRTCHWAHNDRSKASLVSRHFQVFQQLGDLLSLKGNPKRPQHEGFCHGFAMVH